MHAKDCNIAVVVGMPRSATTLVCEALGQHPSILAFGELFHHKEQERLYFHSSVAGDEVFYRGPSQLERYLVHLRSVAARKSRPWLAFKLMDYQEAKLWRMFEGDPTFRLIYTKRDNPLEALVSTEVGQRTQVWHARNETERGVAGEARVIIPYEQALEHFQRADGFEERLRTLRNPVFAVSYNRIAENFSETMQDVFAFLDLPRSEVRPTQLKIARETLRQRVVNYDDLSARFAGTKWRVYFEPREESWSGKVEGESGQDEARKVWQPEQISLSILTVPRNPTYVLQTITSLFAADPLAHRLREICIAVDADENEELSGIAHHQRLRIVSRNREESQRAHSYALHQRACQNYFRALNIPFRGYRGLVVCEDDIVFRDGWLTKLLETLNEMAGDGIEEFVLAGYSAVDHHANPCLRRGKRYSSYVASSFYGTQCVLYSAGEAEAVRSILWERGVVYYERPYDLLVNQHCTARQNLYATSMSIAQHAGAQTTGLGGHFHTSPTFGQPWPMGS